MGFVADAVGGVIGGVLGKKSGKKQARDLEKAAALASAEVDPFKQPGIGANNLMASALGIPGYGGGTYSTGGVYQPAGSGAQQWGPAGLGGGSGNEQLFTQIMQAGGPAAQEMQSLIQQGANPVSAMFGVMQGGGPGASELMSALKNAGVDPGSWMSTVQSGGGAAGGGGAGGADNAFQQYMNSTGARFAMDQGMDAIVGNKATKGLLNSGSTLKAAQQFGQGLTQQRYDNWLGQLSDVANRGANAANTAASVVGQGATAAANARAGGRQAMNSGLGQAFSATTNFLGDIFG